MPKVTLPMGMGLDRYTGVMRVQPGSMRDMRNVRPQRGRLTQRRGITRASSLPAQGGNPCTAVVAIQPVQSSGEGVVVGFYAGSGEVHIFRVSGTGKDPFHIGQWFTLGSNAESPPYVLATESYGKAFLAHDEAIYSARAPTQVYDVCLLYTSPSPRDRQKSRMPSSA